MVISTGTTIETVTVSASTSRTSRPTTTTTLTSSPTQTGDSGDVLYGGPVRGDAPPDLGQPEIGREGAQEEGNYNRNDGSKVPQKMLVAGAVVGMF